MLIVKFCDQIKNYSGILFRSSSNDSGTSMGAICAANLQRGKEKVPNCGSAWMSSEDSRLLIGGNEIGEERVFAPQGVAW